MSMTDRLSPQRRSRLMSRIRGANTKPGMTVRRSLHGLGFRFKLHDTSLPGKPDLVLPRYRTVVLVHGCYWHGHRCRYGRAQSKSNLAYWTAKLIANKRRDRRVVAQLRRKGWKV